MRTESQQAENRNTTHASHDDATAALTEATKRLRYDGTKKPASLELRAGWGDIGRAWIVAWVTEFGRDLRIIASGIAEAKSAEEPSGAVTPLENALWRLDSAREKFHAIVALAFGIPSLRLGTDKKQTITFRPDEDQTRAKLKELAIQHPAAQRVLDADATAKSCLLLRHQIAHSLAPIANAPSLTFIERGLIRAGSVYAYQPTHLPASGLEQLNDQGSDTLVERSIAIAERGLKSLARGACALADLLDVAAELEPPPILWYVTELRRSFLDRQEALAASKAASHPHVL